MICSRLLNSRGGKNTSDTIGSLVKGAFLRGMAQENEGIVSNAEGVVEMMRKYSKPETEKFEFFRIEKFPVLSNRIPEDERESAQKSWRHTAFDVTVKTS